MRVACPTMKALDSARARKQTAMIFAKRRTTNMGGVAMDTSSVDRPAAAMCRFTLPCRAPMVPKPRISSRCLQQLQHVHPSGYPTCSGRCDEGGGSQEGRQMSANCGSLSEQSAALRPQYDRRHLCGGSNAANVTRGVSFGNSAP